ncbi:MAG: UrcA family protein [Sphingobium sp.]
MTAGGKPPKDPGPIEPQRRPPGDADRNKNRFEETIIMFAPAKFFASAAAAMALLAGASAASAGTFEANGRSVEVRHGDLNLASKADQKVLRGRISRAAMEVCTDKERRQVNAQCRWAAAKRAEAPVAQAIARAASSERFADAGNAAIAVGN